MRYPAPSILAVIIVSMLFFGCITDNVNGIKIESDLCNHLEYSESRKLNLLIKQTLDGDEVALQSMVKFWCGGAAGCYDLGFVITQIIYRVGEAEFLKMISALDDNAEAMLSSLIDVGLEYGDHNGDGKTDDRRIEEEFPSIHAFLSTNKQLL